MSTLIKTQVSFQNQKATLYLISTPIGNFSDITFRAVEILGFVDVIYAEDTRVTLKLLNYYNIKKSVYSYHSFNEETKYQEIYNHLEKGLNVGYVTDAGTPLISDPGYFLVSKIRTHFNVVSIPGASAVLAALVSSGLIPEPFTFVGFIERKKLQRIKTLRKYKDFNHTLIFYERADRVKDLVADLYLVMGKRKCVFARELTKIYETIYEFNLGDNIENITFKGEFVVLVEGAKTLKISDEKILSVYQELLKEGKLKSEAIRQTASLLNVKKNFVYELVLKAENKEL